MTTTPFRKLPLGIQDFDKLRKEGYLYVDKTDQIYNLVTIGALNHLDDISLGLDYTDLCGMTRPEIEANFGPELTALGKTNGLTYDQTMEKLTRLYDGYKFFQVQDEKVFNPFSVL